MNQYSKAELLDNLKNKQLPDYVYLPNEGLVSVSADICAIANYKGGILIFGINKELDVVGVEDVNYHLKIINKKVKLISPIPKISITIYIIYNKDIVLVETEELKLKDKLAHVHFNAYVMRQNKTRALASFYEKAYFASFSNLRDTETTRETDAKEKLLDYDLFQKFMKKAKTIVSKNYTSFQIEALFRLRTGSRYPTFCKEVCFGLYPQMLHPNCDIFIYDDRINEKLLRRITGNIYFMLKDTLMFLKEYLGMVLYINDKKEVVRKEAYPLVVLKEVVYNSLIHREYGCICKPFSNEIHIKESSIVITNPGGFICEGNMKEDTLKIPRNPSIKKVNDLLLETPSSERGISSVFLNMKKYGYIEPTVFYSDGKWEVTLYNKTVYDFYNENISVKRICDFCIEPKTRLELYNHFYNNGKSTPYYFMNKYIIPLIYNGVLKYTNTDHVKSKHQKIQVNTIK